MFFWGKCVEIKWFIFHRYDLFTWWEISRPWYRDGKDSWNLSLSCSWEECWKMALWVLDLEVSTMFLWHFESFFRRDIYVPPANVDLKSKKWWLRNFRNSRTPLTPEKVFVPISSQIPTSVEKQDAHVPETAVGDVGDMWYLPMDLHSFTTRHPLFALRSQPTHQAMTDRELDHARYARFLDHGPNRCQLV